MHVLFVLLCPWVRCRLRRYMFAIVIWRWMGRAEEHIHIIIPIAFNYVGGSLTYHKTRCSAPISHLVFSGPMNFPPKFRHFHFLFVTTIFSTRRHIFNIKINAFFGKLRTWFKTKFCVYQEYHWWHVASILVKSLWTFVCFSNACLHFTSMLLHSFCLALLVAPESNREFGVGEGGYPLLVYAVSHSANSSRTMVF